MAQNPAPRKRPGGRTARVGQAVHEAVRDLIAERGRDGFTGRDVAERAGVHEATLYRRWGTLDNLVLDVAASVAQLNEKSPIPDTGSLRGDLLAWAGAIVDDVSRPEGLALLRTVLAVRTDSSAGQGRGRGDGQNDGRGDGGDGQDRQLTDFLSARAVVVQQALDRAADRGEAVPELTTVFDHFLAPLYLRAIFGYCDPAHDLDGLVDLTLGVAR
ncbi:TetR/AcrR family transcriptional regulator [Streptomyces sp. SID10853]|uniref:TetR/AcrR family transcriptional regulator n=1 Tax=Streptomyces sp. SID10853 TaxID=2706028 RepID=UPI0013C0605B|nr:TetR/AcrR family transcriptional regulator [Streptomyces sp. SID10853]NDZ80550.1 TetR/AcrR family transcriptional regulator [Streptomyces sp. SID10853]